MDTQEPISDLDPSQPLSIDEAMQLATRLHRSGRRSTAYEIYRRVLTLMPEHPDALHFMGLLANEQGSHADAIRLMAHSVDLVPEHAGYRTNFGTVLAAAGRFEEAEQQYRVALTLDPDRPDALNDLAVLCGAMERFADAEQLLVHLLGLYSDFTDARHNLARLYLRLGRIDEALAQGCEAIVRDPNSAPAREILGYAYCKLGRFDDAARVYHDWLVHEPNDPRARYLLAACTGESVPPRAPDAYVRAEFDGFAESFDRRLAMLGYRAPALTAAALTTRLGAGKADLEVLDAGCGTGLCAPLLKPFAARLTGVDLSAGMLAKARARRLYDALAQAELTDFMRGCQSAFDIIVSADTLVYFGALDEALLTAALALRPGGLLCFTLEALAEGEMGDYCLHHQGRFAHADGYVRTQAGQSGLIMLGCEPEVLRREGAELVRGWVVLMQKPA